MSMLPIVSIFLAAQGDAHETNPVQSIDIKGVACYVVTFTNEIRLHGTPPELSLVAGPAAEDHTCCRLPEPQTILSGVSRRRLAISSSAQNTMVRPKSVTFLARPSRRNGVFLSDANCASFQTAASINARPLQSAANPRRI